MDDYRLRDIEEEDLVRVLEWRNSDRIRANMFSDHFITFEEHKAWYMKIKQGKGVVCKVFEFKGRPVGLANFSAIDEHSQRCYWGFYLGETDIPPGTGAAMGFLGLGYAFEQLGIRKLCGEVLASNLASMKFHQKLGFCEEGKLVSHILKNGCYHDIIIYALFQNTWILNKSWLAKFIFSKENAING